MTLPVGKPIPPFVPVLPRHEPLPGRFVTLRPLRPAADAPLLFAHSHGSPEAEAVWTYMGYGPFADVAAMAGWLESCAVLTDPLFFAIVDNETKRPFGMTSLLAIEPDHKRLELGHIWLGLPFQRSRANTEAAYLLLRETFETLGYRRAEWKCDALNERSRRAALRLGFHYEGCFRQHRIYKGRNRDTAWFSLLDGEWQTAVKANLEAWLYDDSEATLTTPPAFSLRARNGGTDDHFV